MKRSLSLMVKRVLPWLLLGASGLSVAMTNEAAIDRHLVLVQPQASQQLQQKTVMQIHEDQFGYLWFVTQGALHRFDGHDMLALPQPSQTDAAQLLARHPVAAVTSTDDGLVWIATLGEGLLQFDPRNGSFRTAAELGLPHDANQHQIFAIAALHNDVYWLSAGGLFVWQSAQQKTQVISSGDATQKFTMLWQAGDRIWLASEKNLWTVDAALQPQRITNPLMQGHTSTLTTTPSGAVIAFGSYGAVVQWQRDANFQPFVIEHPAWRDRKPNEVAPFVAQALIEPDGRLWAAVPGIGLLERQPDGQIHTHQRDVVGGNGLQDENITSLCRDRAGRLWLGTLSNGVFYRAEGHQWFTVLREKNSATQQSSNNVFAILPDQKGGLWLGLEGSGLHHVDLGGHVTDHTPAIMRAIKSERDNAAINHLHVRSLVYEGDTLVVGHSRGVFRYWPASQRVQVELAPWFSKVMPGRSAVRAMRRRHNGDWLIASDYMGLLIWQKNGDVTQYSMRGVAELNLPTDRVLDVIEDGHQQLWLATDAGLFRVRAKARPQAVVEFDQSRFVNTLYLAGPDELWVGSFGGLARVEKLNAASPVLTRYTTQNGLFDNVIYAVQSDKLGHVWASSNLGLMRLPRAGARWQHFDRQDGLSDDEFNLNAVTTLPDGRLAFGGISGVSLIAPEREPTLPTEVPLVVSAMQIGNGEVQTNWSQQIESVALPADNSQLMLRFASPGAGNRHQQHFFYRFATETKWTHVNQKRELQFANLPIGKQTLEAAWTYGDTPTRATLRLELNVVPAWWQRRDVQWGLSLLLLAVIAQRLWSRHQQLQQHLQQEKALRASDERLRLALWGTGDALWDWQITSGQVLRTGMENMLGFNAESIEATFTARERLMHPDDIANANNQLQLHLDGVLPFYEAQYRLRNAQGDWVWILDRGHIVERDDKGKPTRLAGTMRDVSDKHRRDEELQFLANYDSLTKLPNRTLFQDRLRQAIVSSERRGLRVALVFIDLDRFKSVNDSYGHHSGDELLCAVATRLRESVRAEDTVARLGGDEFTVVIGQVASLQAMTRVIEAIQRAFAIPFVIGEKTLQISPSIGVSIYPDDADSADKLLNHADMAMYAAKEQGRNTLRYFERSMNDAAQRRASLSLALRKAEDANELLLHFQPRMAVADKHITGFEALMRWNSPTLGNVSPAEFIPIAEEFGLIGPLGYWVLRAVMQQLQAWQGTTLAGLPIAVNVSIRQLFDPHFQHRIAALLSEYRIPSSLLHIEVTETVLMENVEQAIATLQALRDMGIAICIDDFGTGYSSLGYLRRLPIDGLKVDKSFVNSMMRGGDDAVIVDTIIAMAHALRLYVVAEGVETREQYDYLQQKGCEEIQGYWLARPMPASDCETFMQRFHAKDNAMWR